MEYHLREINRKKTRAIQQMEALLQQENISMDRNLDYSVGLYDEDGQLVATGSCFTNTLRCLAVDHTHQGEGLLDQIVSHLTEYQIGRGYSHLFIYTKAETAKFFTALGFHEIALVGRRLSFLENRKNGFQSYLQKLSAYRQEGSCAALIVNCNPFTLGHQYLIEHAARENDWLHLFLVSEDVSLFPLHDRARLVKAGCAHLNNVIFHETGKYMISNAVFPSYFLKDEDEVIESHAALDIALFLRIAEVLNIQKRYVGEEPFSKVTNIYNCIMNAALTQAGIACIVIPRMAVGGDIISASKVRKLIQEGKLEEIQKYVPTSTYEYFFTEGGKEVTKKIMEAKNVIHY